jgi:hypothetical protein
MGWYDYSYSIGLGQKIGNKYTLFDSDPFVRFFIDQESIKKCFIIKELSPQEKQKSKNSYKFIIADYNNGLPDIETLEFNSNEELFKMVIKYEACNEDYQRHFKINKLLNK